MKLAELNVLEGAGVDSSWAFPRVIDCSQAGLDSGLRSLEAEQPSHVAGGLNSYIQDGGGLCSNGSWAFPREPDCLGPGRLALLRYLHSFGAFVRFESWSGAHGPFLSDAEVSVLQDTCVELFTEMGVSVSKSVAPGQPLALDLFAAFLTLAGDVDACLPGILRVGVPTGVLRPIAYSGVFAPRFDRGDAEHADLWQCESNWGSAESDEAETVRLHAAGRR